MFLNKWNCMNVEPLANKKILVIWSDGDEIEYESIQRLRDYVNMEEKLKPILWTYA